MSRDRILISVLVVAALVGGFWFAILGPKRDKVRSLDAQVATQRQRLERAQADVAQAQAARARYDADYSAVVMLGKAVPEQPGMPSLLYQIDSSARDAKIDFSSITADAAGATPTAAGTTPTAGQTAAAPSASGSASPAAAVAPTAMPLSFIFTGSFFDMEHLLDRVNGFVRSQGDDLAIRGRLLSVDDISLAPASQGLRKVQATISASAYTMPPAQTPDGAKQPSAAAASSASATPTTTTATGNTP